MADELKITLKSNPRKVTLTTGLRIIADNPDVTRLDDTTASDVSADPIDVQDYLGTPTALQLIAAFGRGYAYPQTTGAATSYRSGDDKDIEDTIFTAAVRNANALKILPVLVNFTTLASNNSFDNTDRLTDSVGGQDYDGTSGSLVDYLIDNYTGLGYLRVFKSAVVWDDAVDDALAATDVTFSDWFLTNYNQLISIFNHETAPGTFLYNYSPFSLSNSNAWTSTTNKGSTTQALRTSDRGRWFYNVKSNSFVYLICRKHF